MTALDRIRLDVTAIGRQPVIVRFGKDPTLALEKRDALNEFLRAIVVYVGVGSELRFESGDDQYVLTLKSVNEPRP